MSIPGFWSASHTTRAAFFQGANVGTVVKTKGTNPYASPLVAAEAELENYGRIEQ